MTPVQIITFGRDASCNVVLNDPGVSRQHCQIVQFDNGTFSIVDLGSKNGTFVNGRRIYGETPLTPGCSVKLCNVSIPWLQYFRGGVTTPTPLPKKPSTGKVATLVSLSAVALAAIAVLVFSLFSQRNIPYEASSQAPAEVLYTEDGEQYSVMAIPGEVVIIFDDDVSHREAKHIIKQCGGSIIAQMPKIQYYLVSVTLGEEDAFIQQVRKMTPGLFIYPNAVSEPCMAKPVVLDNDHYIYPKYNATHGEMVKYSFTKGVGEGISVDFYDIGVPDSYSMDNGLIDSKLFSILNNIDKKNSPVINMSFGSGYSYGYEGYWDEAPDAVRKAYIRDVTNEIKKYVNLVKNFDDRDFVIVKALGNRGVKTYDKEILQPLLDKLDDEEESVLNRHFLLVAAKDDNRKTYSNEMSPGTYNSLIATTDISDMRWENSENMHGTSYASPLSAGFISKIMNEYDISAVDALQYAKQATQQDPNHLLTYQGLESIVKQNVDKPQDDATKVKDKDNSLDKRERKQQQKSQEDLNAELEQLARDWLEAFFTRNYSTVHKLSTDMFYNELADLYRNDSYVSSGKELQKVISAARELPASVVSQGDNRYYVRFDNRPQGIEGYIFVYICLENGQWKVYKMTAKSSNRRVQFGQ